MNTHSVDTPSDSTAVQWLPVIPSSDLPLSINVTLGFLEGEEVALWRSSNGAAQAWVNKCPHRGLRFTLGRVLDDRLSCAYHGWEYQAGDGRCVSIPAHPQMAAPRNVCATTFHVAETNGMVWVSRQAPAGPPPSLNARTFLRTLGIRAPQDFVAAYLEQHSWRPAAHAVFKGEVAGLNAFAYLTNAGSGLVLLHIAVDTDSLAIPTQRAHALLRQLRTQLEAAWNSQGELQCH